MEMFKRGQYWWAYFCVNGKRIRKSTKETKKTPATEVAMQMLREAAGEGAPARPEKPLAPPETPTLSEFARDHFLPYVEACGRSTKTKEGYRYGWQLLEAQVIAGKPLGSMLMDEIKTTHVEMIHVPWSPSTHNCALRTLSRMYTIALDLKLVTSRPKIELRDENERTNLIDATIEQKIAAQLAQSKRTSGLETGLYVILDCGLRPFEIVALAIADISFDDGLIWVKESKTKAGKRPVPMTTRVREKLTGVIGSRTSGWVFPSPRYDGQHIQRQALTANWRRTCNRAGVSSDLDLYCGRHTYGTDVMEATKNPFLVMGLMGHTKLDTTKRYQHHGLKHVGALMDGRNESRHNLRHNLVTMPIKPAVNQ